MKTDETKMCKSFFSASVIFVLLLVMLNGCSETGGGPLKLVTITASSNMFPLDEKFSPKYLAEDKKTIWHAQSPTKYPEWVEAVFDAPVKLTHFGIMSQDTSANGMEYKRAPRDFTFQGSNDGQSWKDLKKVTGNEYSKGGEWKEWDVENNEKFSHYRIYITASGDPSLLTIRQIKLR